MRIQLDYDKKTIRLDYKTNLLKFIEWIELHLPDKEDWMIESTPFIDWNKTIIIDRPQPISYPQCPQPNYPIQPWYETYKITCETNNEQIQGIYNLEILDK